MWKVVICVLHTIPAVLVNSAAVFREEVSDDLDISLESVMVNKHYELSMHPGSDSGLYNEGFFEGDIHRKRFRMKNAVADTSLLWPYGAIVYKLDERIGCPDSQQCSILMKAFDHYHSKSCIRFKEWTGEDSYVRIFFNPDSGACWSAVGRVQGEQMLSLGQRCWYLGIVIHELGHSIGFWHEMNRPDRDQYISINWRNILPGFAPAFAKHDRRSVNTLNEEFDFTSIMMYDEFAFSKDGVSPTIKAKDHSVIGPIWKKYGLSASDIRRLHKLYECEKERPKSGFPYDVQCTFNDNPCGFKNGGVSSWSWRNVNETEGYVYTTSQSSGNETGFFMSTNFHPIDLQEDRGSLGCVRFWYMIKGDGDAYLTLRQSYLERVTQLVFVANDTFDLWENENTTNEWTYVELPIYVTKPFKLIFESEFKNSTNGVIALDDLQISYIDCGDSTDTTTDVPPLSEIWTEEQPTDATTTTTTTTTTSSTSLSTSTTAAATAAATAATATATSTSLETTTRPYSGTTNGHTSEPPRL